MPVRQLAEATPARRDRVIDGLRAGSLSVVVIGHCAMALVYWHRGVPELGNVLAAHRSAQLATWVLQVVPLFFVAGGASNALSWRSRRAQGYAAWLWSRSARLLRPVLVYLALTAPIAWLVARLVPNAVSAPLLALSTQLLWFLGAYLVVTALGPLLLRAHDRAPWLSVLGLGASSVVVDVIRFGGGVRIVGVLNFVTVWALCAQLGVCYVDRLIPSRRAGILALVGVGLNALVVTRFHYPLSMVGMPGDRFSNVSPPTTVLMILGVVEALAAIALREPLGRLMTRVGVWRYVVAVNASAMTLYLWHLPVLIVLYVLEHASGLTLPTSRSGGLVVMGPHYPWLWPVHFVLFALGVVGVVSVLWVLESAPLVFWDRASRLAPLPGGLASALGALGVIVCGTGLLVLAGVGLAGFPTRVVHFSGLSLSSGLGTGLTLVGALGVRAATAPRRL